MNIADKFVKIKILKDLYKEYELLAKYNGGRDYDRYCALELAIETMRKYLKIVDIVSLNGEEFKQCGLKELKEILEVISWHE